VRDAGGIEPRPRWKTPWPRWILCRDTGFDLWRRRAARACNERQCEAPVTEKDLARTLFGKQPAAEVLIAFLGDTPAGFALFFHNYSTWLGKRGIYLEDLFVRPLARKHGVGFALLRKLARIAIERDCGRLDWSVLTWNELAITFYKRIGARPMDDWKTFRLTGDALAHVAGTEK